MLAVEFRSARVRGARSSIGPNHQVDPEQEEQGERQDEVGPYRCQPRADRRAGKEKDDHDDMARAREHGQHRARLVARRHLAAKRVSERRNQSAHVSVTLAVWSGNSTIVWPTLYSIRPSPLDGQARCAAMGPDRRASPGRRWRRRNLSTL